MNKLTKVGLSALCGSLAAVSSANAGDMTVTGGVDMTWMSLGGNTSDTGNPIGIGSNLTYKGSGELDNGWTFGVTIAMLNSNAYSTTAVNLDMGALGAFNFNQGDSGNGLDAFDDKMPTAWEEAWGMGLGTGIQLVSGVGPQSNIQYTTPKIAGTTLTFAVAPDMGAADANDKAVSGASDDGTGTGYDMTVNVNPAFGTEILSGLNLFIGGHQTENFNQTAGLNNSYQGIGGVTFDIGPISLGAAASGISTGKTVTETDPDYYKNTMYGVAFNVNDNLSVSYNEHESELHYVQPGSLEAVTMEVESWQIAYTMGGASVRIAKAETTNGSYQLADAFDKEARVVSVSLAF